MNVIKKGKTTGLGDSKESNKFVEADIDNVANLKDGICANIKWQIKECFDMQEDDISPENSRGFSIANHHISSKFLWF